MFRPSLSPPFGEARLFSFGVADGVNHYLLEEMARAGRGVCRIVKPGQDEGAAAAALARRLDAPFLTDISIDWKDAPVESPTPSEIPDLFLGESVRVLARYRGAGTHRIVVTGRLAGETVRLPLDLELPAERSASRALPIVWARGIVSDRMIDFIAPGRSEAEREAIENEFTTLALEHRLVNRFTAFVAVSRTVVNPGGNGAEADVAVPIVKNVSPAAYPGTPFTGHAAPEPAEWAALGLVAVLALAVLLRRGAVA